MFCTSLVISDVCYLVGPLPHPYREHRGGTVTCAEGWGEDPERSSGLRSTTQSVSELKETPVLCPPKSAVENVTCCRLQGRSLLQSTWFSPASAKQGLCEQISPSPGASDSSHLKGDNKISVASSWLGLHKMKESLRKPLFSGPETWEVPTASALAASRAHLHA